MTTPTTQALLPVTPEARKAACEYLSDIAGLRGGDAVTDIHDDHPTMIAFARFERDILARQAHSLPGDVGTALAGLEWSEDGYSLRTPHDGDVDGDGRHVVVGGETVITFADSDVGEEYRERILAALTPSALSGDAGEGE